MITTNHNISGRILKDLQNFTAPILTIIFQKSLQTGCIPTDWKHVAPAYKKVKNTMQQITVRTSYGC
jgi:hypothetical protein